MHRICLCPASIAWIRKHLMKSARKQFTHLTQSGSVTSFLTKGKGLKKHRRSAKQRAATKKLVAFNKRHSNRMVSRRKRRRRWMIYTIQTLDSRSLILIGEHWRKHSSTESHHWGNWLSCQRKIHGANVTDVEDQSLRK